MFLFHIFIVFARVVQRYSIEVVNNNFFTDIDRNVCRRAMYLLHSSYCYNFLYIFYLSAPWII